MGSAFSPAFSASGSPAAHASASLDKDLGVLPRWELKDLYPSRTDEALTRDIAQARRAAEEFKKRWQGKIASLTAKDFGAAIKSYESIEETLSRLSSYAQLVFAENQGDESNARFYQEMQEKITDISTHLLFFMLEINRLDEDALAPLMAGEESARYAPWIRDVRALRAHQLSDDLEQILLEKNMTARAAWTRLFDETIASLRFPVRGKNLSESQALHLLCEPDGELRREAALSIGRVLGENIRLFAMITNTLAKDKEIEDKWRRFERPVSARNLSNHVEDEVVDALAAAVRGAWPGLSHRYYALKARWFGVAKLEYWDRNAPLPNCETAIVPWERARETVLEAYARFSPQLADIGRAFFEKPWIDAPAVPGKSSGAFAHPTVPSVHPYLLLNYQGRVRDVMTLAHELGHGVHQRLAGAQGALMADTPLTLAETASVFGEMLTFRAILAGEKDASRRRMILAAKVEDMLNTVVRQIAFYEFERRVHDERKKGELSVERLGDIWMAVQGESLGPALHLHGDYRHFWAYIPHFIHSPFYVYAYAFGDCLVNSLYAAFEEQPAGFAEKYLAMLSAGGTKRHKELLAPFNLDATQPSFWNKGLGMISGLIDELEAVA